MGEESAAWHIVRTRGADPAVAAIGCERAGLEVFMPVSMVRVGTRGNRLQPGGIAWQPVFPGSLFVRFNLGRDTRRLCEIYGIDDLLRLDGKPVPVSDDAVAAIKRAERNAMFDAALNCRLADGETEPLDSRFASLLGRVKRERGSKRRTKLLMELLLSQ
jgi:hypothetical protein